MIDIKKKNIGGNDRRLRFLGGSLLILSGFVFDKRCLKAAGSIFLTTAVIQKCVFYDLLNIDTYSNNINIE